MVTTKNYERQVQYKLVGRLEGQDKVLTILGIPLGSPDLKTAVDRTIDAGKGVYLANAVLESGGWTAILIGRIGYTVTGDVYAAVEHGDLIDPDVEKFELKDNKGELAMVSSATGKAIAVQKIDESILPH